MNAHSQEQASLFAPGAGGGSTALITAITHSGSLRTFPFSLGMKITVGAAGITVTHLGRMCHTGNTLTQSLSIRNAAGTILASASVNSSLGTPGSFQYVALGTPYALSASTSYYIHSDESGGDQFNDVFTSPSVTYTSVISAMQNSYETGGAPVDGGSPDDPYGPLDIKYT